MPKITKAPPAPTLPTAIKSRENAKLEEGLEVATFASGCFWGTEHLFSKYYSHLPQFKAVVGYTGGKEDVTDPSYRQVCTGATDHAEAVQLTYQKGSVGYGELVESSTAPTMLDSELAGPDKGTQYRSAIFYHSPEQEAVARAVTAEVQDKYYQGRPIKTEITPSGVWWNAEDYHQHYLDVNPDGYECPTHRFYW
ncbi:Peptide-methionine (S)-S-oxide reductase [Apiotrichum porosum]|uniref:peptide-methionine (S)-S-oxide reductase n=1 Tax=Apiotrichum porosum TaxID=105984 RepID=A0A427XXR0_9TREE|nr:Peptide-methionine (S)-S-oxide reductase [Apiotrichum porosum]RSH83601.1 Peptide-methionine (S)-S-oxide reductase [Apiotrichum porosum]